MKTSLNSNLRLFDHAGQAEKSSVYSRRFKFSICENQGFIVPWQMTESETAQKEKEQLLWYNHF